jgi:hypothetical protein
MLDVKAGEAVGRNMVPDGVGSNFMLSLAAKVEA